MNWEILAMTLLGVAVGYSLACLVEHMFQQKQRQRREIIEWEKANARELFVLLKQLNETYKELERRKEDLKRTDNAR